MDCGDRTKCYPYMGSTPPKTYGQGMSRGTEAGSLRLQGNCRNKSDPGLGSNAVLGRELTMDD